MRKTSLLFSISLLGLIDLVNSCCTGVAGTAASNFDTVLVDPDNAAGGALTISNTETQTSGELVKITGIAGKTAFKVAAGNTDIQGLTTIADLTATAFASAAATITGGSVNGAPIGATAAAAGTFVALTASGAVSLTGASTLADLTATQLSSAAATITGGSINGAAIGGSAAAAGTFVALTASGAVSLTGASTLADLTATQLSSAAATITGGSINGAAIGGTAIAAGAFSTLSSTSGNVAASDRRFKKNITTITSALDKVKQMTGVQYEFRRDQFPEKQFLAGIHSGFIAQDIEKILPGEVYTGEDGYKAIRYAGVTPVLVEAVKDQDLLISQLKSEVAELKETQKRHEQDMAEMRAMIAAITAKQHP